MKLRGVQVAACLLALHLCSPVLAAASTSAGSPVQAPASAPAETSPKQTARQRIDQLKRATAADTDNEALHHDLAAAYLDDNNVFWALRVLDRFEQSHPPACDSRAFQALIHIRQANFALASQILETPGCDTPDYVAARQALLRAWSAAHQADTLTATAYLRQASKSSRLFAEDQPLLNSLILRYDPGRLPVASGRIGLVGGWTSNGLAGSPVDPVHANRTTDTPLLQLDARLRVVIPTFPAIRPVVEMRFRELELLASALGSLSYRNPSIRPGVLIGATTPRLLVNYGFDAVQIAGRDRYEEGPLWFSQGHRADYELEVTDNLYVFGGAGHRSYREGGRTRWEAEHGLAVGFDVASTWKATVGAVAHWYSARNHAYDSVGGSLLTQVQAPLSSLLEARANASIAAETYPNSNGYFTTDPTKDRNEVQLRVKPALWTASFQGFRAGLEYEYSHRWSSAESFAFDDHRFTLHLAWVFDSDQFTTTLVPADGRRPLEYGLKSSGRWQDDVRIRELMQQDEAVKRGSSCMK